MLNGKYVVVVIPAYNVGLQISGTIEGIKPFVDHIVVVDDCSFDNTYDIVKSLNNNRVTLLRNSENQGLVERPRKDLKKDWNSGATSLLNLMEMVRWTRKGWKILSRQSLMGMITLKVTGLFIQTH